jgi:hypothetical protein
MGQAYAGGASVLDDALVERWRELPMRGSILVKENDLVEADTVIGRATLPGEGILVRVAEELGIAPDEAMQCVTVSIGDEVRKGQSIAIHRVFFGLLKAEVVAPVSGVVELTSAVTGTVMIRLPSEEIQLSAYTRGRITRVEEGVGVAVTAACTLVQGVFGVGGERFGRLRVLQESGDIGSFPRSGSDEGAVIVSKGAPTVTALREAATRGVAGWIAGCVSDAVVEEYAQKCIGVAITGDEQVPFPFFVTEGFGAIPMNEGALVSISGVTQVRAGAVRPEAIIPFPDQSPRERKQGAVDEGLVTGRLVRLIRHPYFGDIGTVRELPSETRQIPTGAYARVAVVELRGGAVVEVPRANIELLTR